MDKAVNEPQLAHDRRREDERVEVGLAYAVVEAIDGIGERQPRPEEDVEVGLSIWIEVDRDAERRIASRPRTNTQAEGVGGLQRIDDVQVVCPGLGEILPGMSAGIAADEILLPIRARPHGIVPLQASLVILALVAEQLAKRTQPDTASDEAIPVVMADLVAKVTEQRPEGLGHVLAVALAFGIVSLGDIDRDESTGVACDDLRRLARTGGGACQKVERQSGFRFFRPADQRQMKPQQPVDEAMLGRLSRRCQRPRFSGTFRSGMVRLRTQASQKMFELPAATNQLQAWWATLAQNQLGRSVAARGRHQPLSSHSRALRSDRSGR